MLCQEAPYRVIHAYMKHSEPWALTLHVIRGSAATHFRMQPERSRTPPRPLLRPPTMLSGLVVTWMLQVSDYSRQTALLRAVWHPIDYRVVWELMARCVSCITLYGASRHVFSTWELVVQKYTGETNWRVPSPRTKRDETPGLLYWLWATSLEFNAVFTCFTCFYLFLFLPTSWQTIKSYFSVFFRYFTEPMQQHQISPFQRPSSNSHNTLSRCTCPPTWPTGY